MAVQPPNRTIFLVGMMGAGKSTIGKALAALMGTKFVDLDRELEERCGVSIPHIFETEGEAGFRCRETRPSAGICESIPIWSLPPAAEL